MISNKLHREQCERYEMQLAEARALITDLIRQVQVTAQGMPHYPQLGPFTPEPEQTFLRDDTGLVEVDVTDDERMPRDLFES